MKTHKIIFAFFTLCAAIVIISACSTKDLELVNPNELSPETFFRTEAQVQSSVNAAYVNLQTIGLFTRAYFFMNDLMGGDAGGNPQLEADKRQYLEFSFDANHGNIGDYWESCYRGINKANFVLGNAESVNAAPITQAKKDKFLGEAKFLRALYNFLLVIRWGDIPLITDIPTTTDGIPKSPKADVYALIISDLQSASATLLDKDVEDKGRANKQAAIALLGKVYLYLEEYDLALAEFNKLNGQFTLEPNFFNNFMDETEHGPESVFEIEYDETLGAGAVWNSSVSGAGPNEATLRGQEYGFNDWFNTYPADDLLAEYEAGDARFSDTFYVAGDMFGGSGGRAVLPADLTVPGATRAAGWKKYQNYYKRLNENINSSINFKYIRYSDVLLMKAECENKRPGGNQDTAIGYVNQVRARAGLLPKGPGLNQQQVFDAIVHERRVELAGEQSRFNDLVRWGMASTELAGQGYQSKHALWPIPAREIQSNPAVTEADQNPGY